MSMSMDTKHYTTTSSEITAPVQEAVDLALYEAAKDGDLHAAFIAVQKGANPGSQHDIVRHAPLLSAAWVSTKTCMAPSLSFARPFGVWAV